MNERSILVVAHAGRVDTVDAARRVIGALREAGARPVLAACLLYTSPSPRD